MAVSNYVNNFNNITRYDVIEGTIGFSSEDIKYTTPLAVSNYVESNYIPRYEINHESTVNPPENKLILGNTLVEYVENYKDDFKYDNTQYTTHFAHIGRPNLFNDDTKFPTTVAVSNYVNYVVYQAVGFMSRAATRSLIEDEYTNHHDPSRNDDFTENVRMATPRAVSNYVANKYLDIDRIQNSYDKSSLTTNKLLTANTINEWIYDNVITTNTSTLGNDRVFSSSTTSQYVSDQLNTLVKNNPADNTFGATYINDTNVLTSLAMSNYVELNYIHKDRIQVFTESYQNEDESIMTAEATFNAIHLQIEDRCSDITNLENLLSISYAADDDMRDNLLITETNLKNILDGSMEKVNTLSVSSGANVYEYQYTDQRRDNQLPTVSLMETYVNQEITIALSGSLGITVSDLTIHTLQVEHSMIFYPANASRIAVELDKYMTLSNDGTVIFEKIKHLGGEGNIIRDEDRNSLSTGEFNETFNSNQFIAGTYNQPSPMHPSTTGSSVSFLVGNGTSTGNRTNAFEVHNTGDVYIGNTLMLGQDWRISFDSSKLVIEKWNGTAYVEKHIFK